MKAIDRAIAHFGTQAELARRLECKRQQVNQWVKGERPIPLEQAARIEKLTGAAVTLRELRPDLAEMFDNAASASATCS